MTTREVADLARLPVIQGALLGIREDGIAGWAWNPAAPHETLEVEVLANGELAGVARAELFEPSLAEQGVGNGSHAFRFLLGQVPDLPCRIEARIPGTRAPLPGGLVLDGLSQLATALRPEVRFEGQVDEYRLGRIHGWVVDRCRPGARVRVALRDWKEILHYVVADIHRPGLEQSGKGDGRCAFALRIPVTLLDGGEHTLRITVEDLDWELPNGRIVFDPATARNLVEVVVPWRSDVARIDTALSRLDELISRVEQRETGPLLARLRRFLRGSQG